MKKTLFISLWQFNIKEVKKKKLFHNRKTPY